MNQEKLKDHNMQPVGLGNIRILVDYAPKYPRTLAATLPVRAAVSEPLLMLLINS